MINSQILFLVNNSTHASYIKVIEIMCTDALLSGPKTLKINLILIVLMPDWVALTHTGDQLTTGVILVGVIAVCVDLH